MTFLRILKQLINEVVSNSSLNVVEPIALTSLDGKTDTFSHGDSLILIRDSGTHYLLLSHKTGKKYWISHLIAKRSLSMSTIKPQKKSAANIRGARVY